MSALEKLKAASTRSDLALLLGYKARTLSYILYQIEDNKKYTEFHIPKKTGGVRQINAPIDKLKTLQRRLADVLNKCYDEINNNETQKWSISHGFRKKHSIITNATKHKNKRYVFNIDLENFFPSIHFGRIQGFFIKNKHFQLKPEVATTIAQISCHNKVLPQGSPCSPIISNLVGHLLDIRMVNLAKKTKCTYSRYADDLTFSTNKKDFSPKIALNDENNKWIPGKVLQKEIEKVGFKINNKKVSMQYKTSRQTATGLVVNKKVNIKKEYYRKVRSMCYSLFETDSFYLDCNIAQQSESLEDVSPANTNISDKIEPMEIEVESENVALGTLNQLDGILSFIYLVKKEHDSRKTSTKRYKPTAISKLYRKFLFYKHFFSLDMPLIICEGKTDIIYLRCALRQLIDKFPKFVEKNEDNYKFNIRLLNLSKNFKDVFSISEGAPGLASLIDVYKEYMKPFKGEGKKQPVIMLIDNDDGAKEIKQKLNVKDFKEPYLHHLENLFVMPVRYATGKKKVAIEDLFEDSVLKRKLDGKTFKLGDDINPDKEYGKMVFAKKVIEANQNSINFDEFEQIFDRISSIIDNYVKVGISTTL